MSDGNSLGSRGFSLLSHHAHVLICIARDPTVRLREIAAQVGLTERGVQKIVAELRLANLVEPVREGRRNRYRVNEVAPLWHPIERRTTVGALLGVAGVDPAETEPPDPDPDPDPDPGAPDPTTVSE